MNPKERWLTATWPQIREWLPPAPADVLEIGCGPLGGFVPALRQAGYAPIGVDPEAPSGPEFRVTRFEEYAPTGAVDAVVASTSLHHVNDLGEVLDQVAVALRPGGVVVVIEWAWERFDEATARWCLARLGPLMHEDHESWLHRHQQRWRASGQTWPAYWQAWTEEEGLHRGADIVAALDERFARELSELGPYFFPELNGTDADDERDAIAAGTIAATGIVWVGRRRQRGGRGRRSGSGR